MPDDRTEEQREADNVLSEALAQACKAYGHLEEGWAIGDYVICIEYTPFAEGMEGRERYGYVLPFDHMPTHRIKGLLHQIVDLMKDSDE